MKKSFLYVFTVLFALTFATACSSDNDDKVDVIEEDVLDVNASYSGDDLVLKYGESQLLGKEVTFETEDGKTATISMKGLFDYSSLLSKSTSPAPSFAPGVIPGEITTTLSKVALKKDGEKYTFEGTNNSNNRSLNYSGEVTEGGKLTMDLEVVMPNNALVGTWNLAPVIEGEGAGENVSQPMSFKWIADNKIDIDLGWIEGTPSGVILSVSTEFLSALLAGYYIPPVLLESLQTITFSEDGNIFASYKDKETSKWVDSPANLAWYYIKDSRMYVQLNLDMIMNAALTKADTSGGLVGIITQLATLLSEGFPLVLDADGDEATITADETLTLPILSLLTNETIVGLIQDLVPGDYAAIVDALLPQIPGILETTTEMKVSLHLVK